MVQGLASEGILTTPVHSGEPESDEGGAATILARLTSRLDEGQEDLQPKRGVKRPAGPSEDDVKEKRRRKHNELEVKRRKRINSKFDELQALCNCKNDRRSILQAAVDTIRSFANQVTVLEAELARIKASVPSGPLSPTLLGTSVLPAQQQLIFSNSTAPMGIMALDGRFLDCNDAACRLLGKSREELLQTTMFGLVHPKDLAGMFSKIQRLIKSEVELAVIETVYVNQVGLPLPLSSRVYAVTRGIEIVGLLWIGELSTLQGNEAAVGRNGEIMPDFKLPKDSEMNLTAASLDP